MGKQYAVNNAILRRGIPYSLIASIILIPCIPLIYIVFLINGMENENEPLASFQLGYDA
jgi:hypothetical protein